jgi:hypothetical protein
MTFTRARSSTGYDLLAPPLILLTPFISFINHNDYSYSFPELWLCVAGLIALGLLCGVVMAVGGTWLRVVGTAGLLMLFVDLQFEEFATLPRLWFWGFGILTLLLCAVVREHLSRITAPVFATMLVISLLLPGSSNGRSARVQARHGDAPAMLEPAPPVIVHLIFDEFIGIEGIPPEAPEGHTVRHSLRSFLLENGFRVFGRAYSRFHRTDNAIPNSLNYSSVPEEAYFIEGNQKFSRKYFIEGDPKVLANNQYFEDMHEKGYLIHVYQPDYIDFCEKSELQIASCVTFPSGIKPLQILPLSTIAKVELILRNFGELSGVGHTGARYYLRVMRKAVSYGYLSPQWIPGSRHLWSAGGLQILDIVARDVAKAAPGDLYFAHLPTPHSPYVYDRSCNLRPPHAWVDRPDPVPRLERYRLYLEQVGCLQNRLRYVFDLWHRAKLFNQAKIIIQGDHGSRLYLKEPTVANRDQLRDSDYVDSFSTLLAVKAPGLEPKYDESMVAIQDALAVVAHNRPLAQLSGRAQEPYVLLRNREGSEMLRRPMPEFGGLARNR